MPRKTKQNDEDTITISKDKLDALIAQSVAAHLEAKGNNSKPTGEAFAEALMNRLEGQSAESKQVVERVLRQTGRTENDYLSNPRVSVFNPMGDRDNPRPHLVDAKGLPRKTFFCGEPTSDFEDVMTREEIEAYNLLHDDVDMEKPGGEWRVRVKKNGTREELHIDLPLMNRDTYLHWPSRLSILQELRLGKKLPNINVLFEKMVANSTDPEAFIAALQKIADGVNQPATV